VVEGLLNYHFPDNIRELENMIERGVILAPRDGAIDLCHLFTSGEKIDTAILALGKHGALNPSTPVGEDETGTAGEINPQEDIGRFVDRVLDGAASLEDIETRLLTAAVEKAEGNLAAAARMLGLTRPQLAYRLKKRDERS
jgi:transcriptional regulator with AAA-type ATPase domain